MNKKLYIAIPALLAAIVFPQASAAKDATGDWVGQLTGPFDSQYTAQYNHVVLEGRRREAERYLGSLQVGRNIDRGQGGYVPDRRQRQGGRHTHRRVRGRHLFRNG